MAIGVGSPGNLADDGYGFKHLGLWIDANRGNVATDSHVSGVVQAVEQLSCDAWPWNGYISTDCVGLNQNYTYNGYGPSYWTTLSQSRNVWAPEQCWQTSREPQQWDMPPAPPSQVYFGSCNDMFGPLNRDVSFSPSPTA